MKALTLWQPWASMVAMGEKQVETRCWSTKYRGEIAIHSAAKLPPAWLGASKEFPEFKTEIADVLNCKRDYVQSEVRALPMGSILCIIRLCDIRETKNVREDLGTRELIFGNYEDGRYAWFFEMVKRFDEPIPAKGNRLLWEWNALAYIGASK